MSNISEGYDIDSHLNGDQPPTYADKIYPSEEISMTNDRIIYVKLHIQLDEGLNNMERIIDEKIPIELSAESSIIKNTILKYMEKEHSFLENQSVADYSIQIEFNSNGVIHEWGGNNATLLEELHALTGNSSYTAPSDDFILHLRHNGLFDEQVEDLPSYKKSISVDNTLPLYSTEESYDENNNGSILNPSLTEEIRDKTQEENEDDSNSEETSLSDDLETNLTMVQQPRYGLRSHTVSSSHIPGGVTGLSNLGNTCYMNSALQCLSNTTALTSYFLSNSWKNELNTNNPLGMKGMVAKAYADLIEHLWDISSARSSSFSPRYFKGTIGSFNSTFSGYGQQDSQELLGFLLDGLHEDLNRIIEKPYVEIPDMSDETDAECAKKLWELYGKRNDSIIVDLFQGQYKSRLECTKCSQKSVTFDPYMFLSLPVPDNTLYTYTVYVVGNPYLFENKEGSKLSESIRPILVDIEGDKNLTLLDAGKLLCDKLGWSQNAPPTSSNSSPLFWVAELYREKVHKVYKPNDRMSSISKNDEVFFFYLGVSGKSSLYNHEEYSKKIWGKLLPTSTTLINSISLPVYSTAGGNFTENLTYGNADRWNKSLGVISVLNIPSYLETTVSEPAREELKTPVLSSTSKKRTASTCKIGEDENSIPSDSQSENTTNEDKSSDEFVDASEDLNSNLNVADKEREDEELIKEKETSLKIGEIEFEIGKILYGEILKGILTVISKSSEDIPAELLHENEIRKDLFKIFYVKQSKNNEQEAPRYSFKYRYGDEDNFFTNDWCSQERADAIAVGLVDESEIQNINRPYSSHNDSKTKLIVLYDHTVDPCNKCETYDSCGECNSNSGMTEPKRKIKKVEFDFSGKGVIVIEWNETVFNKLYVDGFIKDNFSYIDYTNDPSSVAKSDGMPGTFYNSATKQIGKTVVDKNNTVTLMDCIDEFRREETLGVEDTWYCPKCKEHVQARKKLDIWSVPEILVFHLKRFSNSRSSSYYSGRSLNDKIDLLVNAPIKELDLTDVIACDDMDSKSNVYDLYAISNHYGGLGGGHYTAYGKNAINGKWYDFDDSRVSEVSESTVMTKQAYLLFYRRRKASYDNEETKISKNLQDLLLSHQHEKIQGSEVSGMSYNNIPPNMGLSSINRPTSDVSSESSQKSESNLSESDSEVHDEDKANSA